MGEKNVLQITTYILYIIYASPPPPPSIFFIWPNGLLDFVVNKNFTIRQRAMTINKKKKTNAANSRGRETKNSCRRRNNRITGG